MDLFYSLAMSKFGNYKLSNICRSIAIQTNGAADVLHL